MKAVHLFSFHYLYTFGERECPICYTGTYGVKEVLNIANCFLLQFQSGVCDYNILIQPQFSHSHWEERHLLSDRITQPHILTLFLNLNQYFNLNIIAYNSYGNVSFSSTSISKHL